MLRELAFGFESPSDRNVFIDSAAMSLEHGDTSGQLDDVFGSGSSSPTLSHQDDNFRLPTSSLGEHSDVPRLRSVHVTNGYREGLAASKEQYIQAGFDEGYSLGAEIGLKAGWCLGVLLGLQKSISGETDGGSDIADLLAQCTEQLSLKSLFGPTYFGPDGIWLFDVLGQETREDQITFELVAAAHPVIHQWTVKVKQAADQMGFAVSSSSSLNQA